MPKVIRTSHFPARPYSGISLCGLIFFRKDVEVTQSDIRHETIHYYQQREWLFVFFFLLYFFEFLWHLIRFRNWQKAYLAISFEREAYRHAKDVDYLRNRRLWANYRE